MKIDRRSFLSLGIGGAVGTALSPLPWKMIDDSSIWTQMWPWTPVPSDGAASYAHSVCALCPGGCGISVRKIDNRAVKIEGRKGFPINDGGICVLGLSGLQLLYGPTRVKSPMKRVGKRGEGKWKKVSWDDAISEIVVKLSELRSQGQSHTVGCVMDTDKGTVPQLFGRLLTAYGSPNFVRTSSMQDSYELATYFMHGVQTSVGFDIENADFVLSFGSGMIEGWGSPVRMFRANSGLRSKKGTVVQVEPRLSNTAAKSDKWLPINPGTEAALAMGMAHVIISEALYHKDFVDNYSFGFDNWTDNKGIEHKGFKQLALDEYDPSSVSETTGIDESDIESLARNFAGASKPIAICGRGQGDMSGSVNEFMAVHALNALVGNINNKGGVCALPDTNYIKWSQIRMDSVAAKGMKQKRIDEAGTEKYPHTRYLPNKFVQNINSGKGSIQALFVAGSNPCYAMPDANAVNTAFKKVPFVVSFSSYMDETAANADLILPNHVFLERYEDIHSVGISKPFIGLSQPVIEPMYNTKHTGDAVILIAKALGGGIANAFAWDDYESCLKETLGDKWNTMVENGFWSANSDVPSWKQAFKTPSKKFEFFAMAAKNKTSKDTDSLPNFNSIEIEGDEGSYPFVLVSYDSMRLPNGSIGTPPFAMKTVEDTMLKGNDILVEVNPRTARIKGLSEGTYAALSTPKGKAKVKVHISNGIMPGVIALPKGLGHTAYDKYLAGKGVNFNQLIGPVEDPVSGLDVAWGIRAKLTRA